MSLQHASSRRHGPAMFFGLVIMSALLVGRALPAWGRWRKERRAAVTQMLRALQEATELVRIRDTIATVAASRRALLDSLRGRLLTATTNAEASARLAAEVGATASANGVWIASLSVRTPAPPVSGIVTVGVRVSALAELRSFGEWLSTLEQSDRLMAVQEIAISRADQTTAPVAAQPLRVDLRIDALALVDSDATARVRDRGRRSER